MSERIIPITDARRIKPLPELGISKAGTSGASDGLVADALGRTLRDLRISVTDRCNFRCVYCMPKEIFGPDYKYLARSDLLSFEEIIRLVRVFRRHGIQKVRLTGGEPLLRRNLERLITDLSALGTVEQPLDITLTTNGSLLAKKARALREAGLTRITVSLDSLDDETFRAMNDVDFPVSDVLEGIDAALAAGLAPVKVNMVVKRGVNDHHVVAMAKRFKGTGCIVRFIEYMDVGASNGWRMDDVVPSAEIVRRINAEMPLEQADPHYRGEVAERWLHADGSGEIGVISSVTQAFCRDCNRARLSTDGMLYTCLFASQGYDLRTLIRNGTSDDGIAEAIARLWSVRDDRYSEIRTAETAKARKVEMSYIGG